MKCIIPSSTELATEPDIVEMAEDMAEQFRSMLTENDYLEERIYDFSMDWVTRECGDFDDETGVEIANQCVDAIRRLLLVMVAKVFAEGDWSEKSRRRIDGMTRVYPTEIPESSLPKIIVEKGAYVITWTIPLPGDQQRRASL